MFEGKEGDECKERHVDELIVNDYGRLSCEIFSARRHGR